MPCEKQVSERSAMMRWHGLHEEAVSPTYIDTLVSSEREVEVLLLLAVDVYRNRISISRP